VPKGCPPVDGRNSLDHNRAYPAEEESQVPCFRDEAEVYEYIGRLFQSIVEDDELAPRFQRANTVMQYRYSEPDSQITVKLLDGEEPRVDLGPTDLEPEVVMTMDADVAHRFWLGEVNVTMALARGQMRASGPVAKILRLVPHAKRAFPRYRAILEDAGREDLLHPVELASR
jgi:putative sterol carrier protein